MFTDCKPGDIITYTLGGTHSYTSVVIHLNYTDEIYSVLDIATNTSTYTVPQAYVFNISEGIDEPRDLEVVGHIDLISPIKDQFPELFL